MATKADRFPKQYFNAEMLKGKPLVLVIDEEKCEPITDRTTGKTTEKSVLSFRNHDAKLILNATNFDLVCEVTSCTDSADWAGHEIELFCDRTSMGSERVDCVRVRAPQPPPNKKTKVKPALIRQELEEDDDVLANEEAAALKAGAPALKIGRRNERDDDIPF